jgi:hypothetical protein
LRVKVRRGERQRESRRRNLAQARESKRFHVVHAPAAMQIGCGIPNELRSQHSEPAKQLFGETVQPCTKQL